MNTRDAACDLVSLARRYQALGGGSTIGLLNPTPDVLAVAAAILATEPRAWALPHGNVPGVAEINVGGVHVNVWGVDRPQGFEDAMEKQLGEKYDATLRAGLALIAMAGMSKRAARKAA